MVLVSIGSKRSNHSIAKGYFGLFPTAIFLGESQFVFVLKKALTSLLVSSRAFCNDINFFRTNGSTGCCMRERKTSARTSNPSSSHAQECCVIPAAETESGFSQRTTLPSRFKTSDAHVFALGSR